MSWKWSTIPIFIPSWITVYFSGETLHTVLIFLDYKTRWSESSLVLEVQTCREVLQKLKILPLHSQYIFSLLSFVANNINQYKVNSDIHGINMRKSANLYQPLTNLSIYQKGTYCLGIKFFKSSSHIKKNCLTILNSSD